jgi:hypothetical protein
MTARRCPTVDRLDVDGDETITIEHAAECPRPDAQIDLADRAR